MPPFDPSPFARVQMVMPGLPVWVFGSFFNTTSPTRFQIRQVRAGDIDRQIAITGIWPGLPDGNCWLFLAMSTVNDLEPGEYITFSGMTLGFGLNGQSRTIQTPIDGDEQLVLNDETIAYRIDDTEGIGLNLWWNQELEIYPPEPETGYVTVGHPLPAATVTGLVTEGKIPDADDHITVTGLKNPRLNAVNARIVAVNINPRTGFGSITYELAQPVLQPLSNQAGTALIRLSPDDEIVSVNQASMAVCLPDSPEGHSLQGFSAEIGWPAGAVGGTVDVQVADVLEDSAFYTLASIVHPKTRFDATAGTSANFVRLMVTTVSGDGSLTGRILVR